MMSERALERVLNEAAGVIANPEAWVDMPNKQLGNKTPRELVQEGFEDEVLAFIEALKDGVIF